jgi:hypothetical protein
MATHEHTTSVMGHLIRLGPLFRRQQSVGFGERPGAHGGQLTGQVSDVIGKLIDLGARFAPLDGVA